MNKIHEWLKPFYIFIIYGNRFSLVDDDHRKIVREEMARIIRGDI